MTQNFSLLSFFSDYRNFGLIRKFCRNRYSKQKFLRKFNNIQLRRNTITTLRCSKKYTFLKTIMEHSRNLYIGQLEQDETKSNWIWAVLVFRNGRNILQGNLAKNSKKMLEFQFFAFLPSSAKLANQSRQFGWLVLLPQSPLPDRQAASQAGQKSTFWPR